MEIDRLIDIGFSENQAKVYIALLKNPERSAGEISKELSIDRSFVYNILESNKQNRSNFEIFEGKFALKKYLSELINSDMFLTLGGGGNLNIFNILEYEHPHYFNALKKSKVKGKVICSKENAEFWKENLKDTKIE